MDVVLEIGKHHVKIGTVGDVDPIVIPIKFDFVGDSKFIKDHSLTKEQTDIIESQLNAEYQQKQQEYYKSLGTWLDIENASPYLLQQIIHNALGELPVSIKRCFVVDHQFSEKVKQSITSILFKYRVKSIVFLPASILYVLGMNKRDALLVNHDYNTIHKVIDLREIGIYDDSEDTESIIRKSDLDIRQLLRENVMSTTDSVGCWTASSIYVANVTTDHWLEITKDNIFV
ncbi:hypothetical protein SBY92_002847 [Candida maltosa Xu316]